VANLHDILKEDDDLKDDDLLKYVQGDLSKEELLEVEKQMVDSEFVNDAVEGLQTISNKKGIEDYVDELNRNLQKTVSTKRKRKEKRRFKDNQWTYIAVIIVLGICLVCYTVIKHYRNQQQKPVSPQIEKAKN
jgi:hypothetical protein